MTLRIVILNIVIINIMTFNIIIPCKMTLSMSYRHLLPTNTQNGDISLSKKVGNDEKSVAKFNSNLIN